MLLQANFGMNLFEEDIDRVIFRTNEFLCYSNAGPNGPFWWILQMCMAIAALFSVIYAAGLAYGMMTKDEPVNVMKLFRPLAIGIVLCWWYPPSVTKINNTSNSWCVLSFLSYIPNAIGSYAHDLYDSEAIQVEDTYDHICDLLQTRDSLYNISYSEAATAHGGTSSPTFADLLTTYSGVNATTAAEMKSNGVWFSNISAGIIIGLDKLIMTIALVIFRIGWWTTIYGQQILLGMLTIFGPLQWAFSILPKWEGAWAKWITRYLTVHFYGACLYFVGFYVLLLFDIVLNIQLDNLVAITSSAGTLKAYIQNAFVSSAYILVASMVALKCLNFVPDLAAWMIPEGDTAFSTRNFGEGVAEQVRMKIGAGARGLLH